MASTTRHDRQQDDDLVLDNDLIDADDAAIEADDPLQTSDTTPLRGNIQPDTQQSSTTSRGGGGGGFGGGLAGSISSNYLTSTIPGEDRRAPQNTIDESVWETLSRDLRAVWEKMRQVLWPKYLLGGFLQRRGGGIGAAERGEASGFGSGGGRWRDLIGRWPDADVVLQGGMSEGLRDWDLWYVLNSFGETGDLVLYVTVKMADCVQGPVDLLPTPEHVSFHVCGRRSIVTGLLGRVFHRLDWRGHCHLADQAARWEHFLLPICLHHRLHALSAGHCRPAERVPAANYRADSCLHCPCRMVSGCWRQHPGRLRRGAQPRRPGCIPAAGLLCVDWVSLLYQLNGMR